LFVPIGAEPHTGWLPPGIQPDRWGFIVTAADLLQGGTPLPPWPLDRPPMLFESRMPGVFAVGDIRHGSVKRVAAAVGEGSVAIRLVDEHLTRGQTGDRGEGRARGVSAGVEGPYEGWGEVPVQVSHLRPGASK
jgi:thioredoxin reductase (NADPH)